MRGSSPSQQQRKWGKTSPWNMHSCIFRPPSVQTPVANFVTQQEFFFSYTGHSSWSKLHISHQHVYSHGERGSSPVGAWVVTATRKDEESSEKQLKAKKRGAGCESYGTDKAWSHCGSQNHRCQKDPMTQKGRKEPNSRKEASILLTNSLKLCG